MSQHQQKRPRFDAHEFVRARPELVEANLEHIRRFDALDKRIRTDANLSGFLARQLVYSRAQIEATIFEDLRAAEFIPVEEGHPRGAMSYSTQRMEHQGEAKITHDLAGDSPRADVKVEEDLRKYVNVRASYGYTVQDLEYAAFAGVPLPAWKGEACADVIARGIDKIGRVGDAAAGLSGFFNSAGVAVQTLTNGEWIGPATATADEIVADLQEIEQALIANTRDTLPGGYVLLLPSEAEGRLRTTPRASGSDMSIATWFLANSRVITSIERYYALDGATGAEVAAADPPMGICYARDPRVLHWPIPIMYEEQAPQLNGWEWVIEARARVGGVDVRRPTHMLYVENLD